MFFDFGSDDQSSVDMLVQDFYRQVVPSSGKLHLFEMHPDDLSLKELGDVLVLSRLAFKEAVKTNARESVQKAILAYHDEIFVLYCEYVPSFKRSLRAGNHEYLGGMERANQKKYWNLAGLNYQTSAS